LRHGPGQDLLNLAQAGLPGVFGDLGQGIQEALAKRIILQPVTTQPIGEFEELGHQVEIGGGAKKGRQDAELAIGIDLLQVALSQPFPIGFILFVRPVEKLLAVEQDSLLVDDGALSAAAFALESQHIAPFLPLVTEHLLFDFDWSKAQVCFEKVTKSSAKNFAERTRKALALTFTDLTFENFKGITVTPANLQVTPADMTNE